MLKTGLPYKMEEMEDINKNGAIVDMSNINFPNVSGDKKYKTTFIFLRNTGFNVSLDFSKCSYTEKAIFLKKYLTENIEIKEKEFIDTYIKILNMYAGNNVNSESILSDEEIKTFIEENTKLLDDVFQLVISLPIFAMQLFYMADKAYKLDDFEKTDKIPAGDNIYNLLSDDRILSLFDTNRELNPKFYTKIFTFENKKLLEIISVKQPFFSILYGLDTTTVDQWIKIIDSNLIEKENKLCSII